MNIEVTPEEAGMIVNALAMQHPLIKKIADQVAAQQPQPQATTPAVANGQDKSDPRMAHIVRGPNATP